MKFLADENIEQQIIDSLSAAGHDVACVSEEIPRAPDKNVLQLANNQSRILITNDRDFGELIFREGRLSEGIVLLRYEAEDGAQKAAFLMEVLPAIEDRLRGHFAVISERRIRLRSLRRI